MQAADKFLLSQAWKRGSKPEVAIIVFFKPFFLILSTKWFRNEEVLKI